MNRHARSLGIAAAVSDAVLLVAAYFGAYELRYRMGWLPGLLAWDRYLLLPLLAIPTWLLFGVLLGLYWGERRAFSRDAVALAWTAVGTAIVLAAAAFLLKQQHQSRPLVVLYLAFAFFQALALRGIVRLLLRRRGLTRRRSVVVGGGEQMEEVCRALAAQPEVDLVGAITLPDAPPPPGVRHLGHLGDAERILRSEVVDEVVFVIPGTHLAEVEHAFIAAEDLGLATKLSLGFLPARKSRIDYEEVGGTPFLGFTTAPTHPISLALKRAFDIVVSAVALVLCAPLFLVIAIAIKLDSPGPVFFGQVRSGLNGRRFTLWKFRSMVVDAEKRLAALRDKNEMSGPVFKMKDDPRVTRVGRFLRRTSLDELPQFWNVLVGQMSVVGPRPPLPSEVDRYERWHRRRLSVKPGITCIWQVSGRNEIDFEDWMKLDLAYIDQWSLWLDIKIVLRTIPAVIFGRGAR
ncbi:MAG TPA: sugar transferase [Fredinandcohnia sp.]|nr:sugar transferase [Fredinandcohnia sp.]